MIFEITKEQFRIYTKENCYYCGIEPLQMYDAKSMKWNGFRLYNGLDRKNDGIGYEINNIVPYCKICNYAKQGLTDVEFLNHIEKIYRKHVEKDTLGSRQEYVK